MLKLKIDKSGFDSLSDELKAMYKADGDSYSLQVDGISDLEKKAKKHDIEVEHRKNAENKVKDLETEVSTLTADKSTMSVELEKAKANATDGKNFDDLEKSFQDKFDLEVARIRKEEVDPLKAENESINADLHDTKIVSNAQTIAAKIAVDETTLPILAERIAKRLTLEKTESGKSKAVVLDADGKMSAASFDDLAKEFNDSPQYARLVKGNQSSGGGANGGENNGNSGANNQPMSAEDASKTGDVHGFISSNLNLG